jgi:hypothetical protein
MFVEIVEALLTVSVIGGLASLAIGFIFARAGARAEREAHIESRLARYGGARVE